jgi:hypothetical protein
LSFLFSAEPHEIFRIYIAVPQIAMKRNSFSMIIYKNFTGKKKSRSSVRDFLSKTICKTDDQRA